MWETRMPSAPSSRLRLSGILVVALALSWVRSSVGTSTAELRQPDRL